MTREITHMRAFSAALESMEKPPFSVGIIQPTPGLVDQFVNASTGEGEEGRDAEGPWNSGNGLHIVRPKAEGGSGLNTKPYDPQPGTEKTSPVDSTPVGEYLNGARAKKPKQRVQHAKAS
jgi:Mn-containing catalase